MPPILCPPTKIGSFLAGCLLATTSCQAAVPVKHELRCLHACPEASLGVAVTGVEAAHCDQTPQRPAAFWPSSHHLLLSSSMSCISPCVPDVGMSDAQTNSEICCVKI